MRSSRFIGGFLALVLVACGGAQGTEAVKGDVASQVAPQVQVAAPGEGDARFLQRFDKNGDGKVELSELTPKMQQRLASADTNKDGVISDSELDAYRASERTAKFEKKDKDHDGALESNEVSPQRWARIQIADTNNDGKITEAELDQAVAAGKIAARVGRHHKHHKNNSPEAVIKRFDANGDGKISKSEVPANKVAWFEKVDSNKDGVVTKDEIVAFRALHHHAGDAGTDAAKK